MYYRNWRLYRWISIPYRWSHAREILTWFQNRKRAYAMDYHGYWSWYQVEMLCFDRRQYTAEFASRNRAYPLLYPFSAGHLLLLQAWSLPITGILMLRFSVAKLNNKKIYYGCNGHPLIDFKTRNSAMLIQSPYIIPSILFRCLSSPKPHPNQSGSSDLQ